MQKWLTNTRDALSGVFAAKPIVLVDVGASGTPPKEWRSIAEMSSFVGFDADLRELREDNAFGFRRFVMINMAVVDTERQEIELHLTASPHCSSMLKPNMANLANYGCTELFEVEKTTRIAATRLDAALRSVGLSGNKAASIRDLATKVTDGTVILDPRKLARETDEEIITRLSTVRGIGRWTAEMFLLFQLRRLDVWPTGDLGVRRGYGLAHGIPMPTPKELEQYGDAYRPYRSVAAWYCWRATEVYAGAKESAVTS